MTGSEKTDFEELINQLKWLHLEKRNDHDINENRINSNLNLNAYIPGGGIAQKFYKIWLLL